MSITIDGIRKEISLEKIFEAPAIKPEDAIIHIALFKTIDAIFLCYKDNQPKIAEENIKMGIELFQQLYPGTSPSDFSKFIVLRKMNKGLAKEILDDSDPNNDLADIVIHNMNNIK
jgi:hypothetical protein